MPTCYCVRGNAVYITQSRTNICGLRGATMIRSVGGAYVQPVTETSSEKFFTVSWYNGVVSSSRVDKLSAIPNSAIHHHVNPTELK